MSDSSTPVTVPSLASSTMLRPLPQPASRMRAIGGQAEPGDHAVEHRAPASIPPVAVLRLVGLKLVVPIHPASIFS